MWSPARTRACSFRIQYKQTATRLALEAPLELLLVEPGVVEAAEYRRQAAERPDQLELPRDEVDDRTEPSLARQVQASLSIALHLLERLTAGEQVCKEVVAAQNGVGEVACLLRRFKDALRKWAAGLDVPRRGFREVPEGQVDAGLQALAFPRCSTRSSPSSPKRNPAW